MQSAPTAAAGTIALGQSLIATLSTTLGQQGLTDSQVKALASDAQTEVTTQAGEIAVQTSLADARVRPLAVAAPAVIAGVMKGLNDPAVALPQADDRSRVASTLMSISYGFLSGRIGDFSVAEVTSLTSAMVGTAVAHLGDANLSGDLAAAATKQIIATSVAGLHDTGIVTSALTGNIAAMVSSSVAALGNLGLQTTILLDSVKSLASAATGASRDAGVVDGSALVGVTSQIAASATSAVGKLNLQPSDAVSAVTQISAGTLEACADYEKQGVLDAALVSSAASSVSQAVVSSVTALVSAGVIPTSRVADAASGVLSGVLAGLSAGGVAYDASIAGSVQATIQSGVTNSGIVVDKTQLNSALSQAVQTAATSSTPAASTATVTNTATATKTATATAVGPAAVTSPSVSPDVTSLMLQWSATDPSVDHVEIVETSSMTKINVTYGTSSYRWVGLATGVAYTFQLTAVTAGGVRSSSVTVSGATVEASSCSDVNAVSPASNYFDFKTSGGSTYLYMMDTSNQYGKLYTYDVTNPASWSLVNTVDLSAYEGYFWYPSGVFLSPSGNYLYAIDGLSGIGVFALTGGGSPAAPQYLTTVQLAAMPMDVAICGSDLYVATNGYGISVIDISTEATPAVQVESRISGGAYPYGVTCNGNTIYLGDGGTDTDAAGLYIYQYNPVTMALTPQSSFSIDGHSWGGHGVLFDNDLFLPWSDTSNLAVFDVTNPTSLAAPTVVSSASDDNTRLLLERNRLYTTYNYSNVGVYDVSAPTTPNLVFTWPIGASAHVIRRQDIAGLPYLATTTNNGDLHFCQLHGP